MEKKDLTECPTINDLMLGKGLVTPENLVLTRQKDFSYRLVGYFRNQPQKEKHVVGTKKIGRDAEIGEFKPVKDAQKDKKGSVVETIKTPPRKTKK